MDFNGCSQEALLLTCKLTLTLQIHKTKPKTTEREIPSFHIQAEKYKAQRDLGFHGLQEIQTTHCIAGRPGQPADTYRTK